MSSIIEGYNYDIFISYRQKDNKCDNWVTEFVTQLKAELEAAFKEDISIYFDENPNDGLLETHSVDKSLEGKLKCLIFIPVISQTYCDPKSFAWQHEFCAFNKIIKEDKFGRDIRLVSGNVASRILPVKIHDLDPEDKTLLESELGGVLRCIDFIYKSPGVNRPLRVNEEHLKDNLNKTYYRDQINKTANAVKEIVIALKKYYSQEEVVTKKAFNQIPVSPKTLNRRTILLSVLIMTLAVFGFLFIPKLFKTKEQVEKSIAVLPFHYLSADTAQAYFCDGIREEILNHLQKIDALSVRSRTSSDQYRNTLKNSIVVGNELNVRYLVEGSIGIERNEIKIWVQLIDAKTDVHIWSEDYIKERTSIFALQSEIAQKIASELRVVLTAGELQKIDKRPTEILEAYQAYLRGRYYARQPHFSVRNWNLALQNFQKAVEIDTGFALAYGELAHAHSRLVYLRQDLSESRIKSADQAAARALKLGSGQPEVHLALGYYYLYAYRDPIQALKHLEIAEKGLPKNVEIMIEKAAIIVTQGRWEEYINLLKKANQLSPNDASILTDLAMGLWCTRRYRDNLDICNQAISVAPDHDWPYLFKIFGYWSWKGPNKESRDALTFIDSEHEWYLFSRFWQEVGEGNFKAALQLMSDTSLDWGTLNKMWAIPRVMFTAFVYDHLDEADLSHNCYKNAVEILERKIADIPGDPRYHSTLGMAYAGLGKKEEAMKEGLKAVALLPVSIDAVYGLGCAFDLAIIYTMLAEFDLALGQLDQLLSVPSWVSPVWFEWDIRFDPLKTHPGYKELLLKYPIEE
jgi:serine/threonine-protein kinase